MAEFITDLVHIVDRYDKKTLLVVLNTEKDIMYIRYHYEDKSFQLSKRYPLNTLKAIEIANIFGVSWSEI